MTPASLRARIAASHGSDQGEILRNAFKFLIPQPLDKYWEGATLTREYKAWHDLDDRIYAMIIAQAYTDAALLIAEAVLPGCKVVSWPDYAEIFSPDHKQIPAPVEEPIAVGTGPSRALAILDAVCAAVENG